MKRAGGEEEESRTYLCLSEENSSLPSLLVSEVRTSESLVAAGSAEQGS